MDTQTTIDKPNTPTTSPENAQEDERRRIEAIQAEARSFCALINQKETPERLTLVRQNLQNVDFSNMNLYTGWHGPDFSGCDCRGANFRNATLYMANLNNTDLRGADFRGCNLREAQVKNITVDATTKGLENFGEACYDYSDVRTHAENCGATPKNFLLAFGGTPNEEERKKYQMEKTERQRYFDLGDEEYQQSINEAKKKGKIIEKKADRYIFDGFDHFESHKKMYHSNPSNIDLDTPIDELREPMRGYDPLSGRATYIAEDVPGGTLYDSNTRDLSDVATSVVDSYNSTDVQFLELGAGAGVATGKLSRMNNVSAVDTCSLSCTSPKYRLNMNPQEIYRAIEKPFKDQSKDWGYWQKLLALRGVDPKTMAGIRRLFECVRFNPRVLRDFPLKTTIAFALQKLLPSLEIFSKCKEPYIRTQFIGLYPAVSRPTGERRYQIIHDDNGPLWHQSRIRSEDGTKPDVNIASLLYCANASLAENGCIICQRIQLNEVNKKALQKAVEIPTYEWTSTRENAMQTELFEAADALEISREERGSMPFQTLSKGDLIVIGEGKDYAPLILAKNNSPIALKVRKLLNLTDHQGGMYVVKNLINILK